MRQRIRREKKKIIVFSDLEAEHFLSLGVLRAVVGCLLPSISGRCIGLQELGDL